MNWVPGDRLGPYEVTDRIGAGGMGEVYRATDSNLKRSVAIKVLPASVAGDADRLARFQREAEMLAALNHPNIAAIYGLEKLRAGASADGLTGPHADSPITALVMEFIDGEDLSQRIARGALTIDEALPIALQIAEALEAAHEQGIVHRDLKPQNIKVRADGTVKVLDFGLAKALDQGSGIRDQGSGKAVLNSPTITTPAMTAMGMILGTAAYMAPEQARGRPVDRRADIWAFGAVLFEMLTGTRAFEGDDVADTLGNVMKVEPAWQRVPPSVPPRVVQVMRACLQKNPKQRMDSAQGVRLALEGAFETAPPQAAVAPPAPAPAARLPWTIAGVAVTLAIALPVFLYVRSPGSAGDAPTMRFEIETPLALPIAISPDGSHLATLSNGLWVRPLEQLTPQLLKGTEGAAAIPFWSPDGRSIAFFADGKLKKVDLRGTPPQTLCEVPTANRSGAWNRDGVILFSGGNAPIQRVSAAGGPTQPVTELDSARGETAHSSPVFLPDGRRFLFLAVAARPENMAIFVGSLDTTQRTLVMASERGVLFAPPHHLVFLRERTLMTQEFDVDRLELRGDPRPVAEQVQVSATAGVGNFSVSNSGILAYRSTAYGDDGRQLSIVDRDGKLVEIFGAEANYQNPVLSVDQQLVAFNRADQNHDIWVHDMVRRTTSRLTFDPGIDDFPIWSPDGARIVFSSNRDSGVFNLYEKQSGGSGPEQLLLKTSQSKIPTDWSRDGRYIVYSEVDGRSSADIWLLPLSGNGKPSEYLRTPFNETQARVSPDGRWLAYRSNESGRDEVYVQSFPQPGSKWQISTDGGAQPQWRRDGRELFYLSPVADDQFMAVDILSGPADTVLKAGVPKKLFVVNVITGRVPGGQSLQRNSYEVWPDGRRLLLNSSLAGLTGVVRPTITVVLNWTAGLGK